MPQLSKRAKLFLVLGLLLIGVFTTNFNVGAEHLSGQAGIAIRINYSAGSSELVDPMKAKWLPVLGIQRYGEDVRDIELYVTVNLDWKDPAQTATATGKLHVRINGERVETFLMPVTDVEKGKTRIFSVTIPVDTLEGWSSALGTRSMTLVADITSKVEYVDGGSESKKAQAKASMDYSVVYTNLPPTPEAGPDIRAIEGATVKFDGSGSTDPDGKIVSYKWSFGDGSSAEGVEATHVYDFDGTYLAILYIIDDTGTSRLDTLTVSISNPPKVKPPDDGLPNVAPVAKANGPYESGVGILHVYSTGSSDSDGYIVSYEWDFTTGGGKLSTGDDVRVMHDTSGTFSVTLTVTDDEGATATDKATIKITGPEWEIATVSPYWGHIIETNGVLWRSPDLPGTYNSWIQLEASLDMLDYDGQPWLSILKRPLSILGVFE